MNTIHHLTNLTGLSYLDGGSGSLMIQVLIASSVTAIYTAKTKWSLMVAAVSKFTHRNSNNLQK
jgi:hypothetical protein